MALDVATSGSAPSKEKETAGIAWKAAEEMGGTRCLTTGVQPLARALRRVLAHDRARDSRLRLHVRPPRCSPSWFP